MVESYENSVSDAAKISMDHYLNNVHANTHGPQAEGIPPSDIEKVYEDERTIFVNINNGDSDTIKWPLFTPIQNSCEFNIDFFERRYGSAENVFYVSTPRNREMIFDNTSRDQLLEFSSREPILVFEETEDDAVSQQLHSLFESNFDLLPDVLIDDKNGTEAAVIHYAGKVSLVPSADQKNDASDLEVRKSSSTLRQAYASLIESGGLEEFPESGTIIVDQTTLNDIIDDDSQMTLMGRLWEIYDSQFKTLTENHPSRQAQTFQELQSVISDPDTLTLAYIHNREYVSFALFVADLRTCEWINPEFYEEKFADDLVLYFPGISTDSEKQGNKYSQNIIDLIARICKVSDSEPIIAFQCTNVSADYIPVIVEGATEATGDATLKVNELQRYTYKALALKAK
jgi:hypothetical protein